MRDKTPRRQLIDDYLLHREEGEWLDLECPDKRTLGNIRSIVRLAATKLGITIQIVEWDQEAQIAWII